MKNDIKIIKIVPSCFCKGVVCAIKLINSVLNDNTYERPLYMLGQLVHNNHITNALLNKGIMIIDDFHQIKKGTIIITAHGLDIKTKQEIKDQGLKIIDATCIEVIKIQNFIINKINDGYDIIYYGKENHPESKAIISIDKGIHFIKSISDIDNLIINNDKICFTNQTTMSYIDVVNISNLLKEKFKNIEINIDICNASKQRQNALLEKAKECDLCLIVGDKKSNNTTTLKNICEKEGHTKAIQIENIEDIKSFDLTNVKTIGITAGASTPNMLVDEIIKSLQDTNYVSKVCDDDYIL